MLDMCCLVLAGPRERLSWRLNLAPRRVNPYVLQNFNTRGDVLKKRLHA